MHVKHSKFRNSGIIFELLVRQVAADSLANRESKAVNIIKRYFTKGELANEQKIYDVLNSTRLVNESKAEILISSALDMAKKLNQSVLRREKYNLIKEIKNVYNVDEFFKSKISNYKILASIYNLIESANNKQFTDPKKIMENRDTLLEHITREVKTNTEDDALIEYSKIDKETRLMSYKILVEKFNEKYGDLDKNQKELLKEYINNLTNLNSLKDYVNSKQEIVKKELIKLSRNVEDHPTSIKLKEMINIIKPIDKVVKDDDIVGLLQYYQLISELKQI